LIYINIILAPFLLIQGQKPAKGHKKDQAMDTTSPLLGANNFPLPPLPMHGARDGVSPEDFKALLAQEGIDSPKSADEAKITAAQIAAKAHVNLRATRTPQLSGMQPAAAPAPVATPGRFMPLREGPAAARAFVAPPGESAVTNSSAGMRTTQKFARKPYLEKSVPAVARTVNDAQASGLTKRMLAAKAAEAYAFGAQGAKAAPATQQVPEWFAGAMENGVAKLEALKAQQR